MTSISTRTGRRAAAAVAVAAGFIGVAAYSPSASASPTGAASATVIDVATTPFGPSLVVGSGKLAGFALYSLTSDTAAGSDCTVKQTTTPVGVLQCTGPETDRKAEWPALTTTGAPVAGPGVDQALLGTLQRSFGEQVTYGGHPLYLFDRGPGQVTGEGWDEPDLPPWHGLWYLVAADGNYLPWAGTLTTASISGQTVVVAQMNTGAGTVDFPLYTYSRDTSTASACASGWCARDWPAMLTSGTPGVSGGLSASDIGSISTPGGSQVTYKGHPLYFYSREQLGVTATGPAATGSGNGLKLAGGTFELTAP